MGYLLGTGSSYPLAIAAYVLGVELEREGDF